MSPSNIPPLRLLARAKSIPPWVGAILGGATAIIALTGSIIGLLVACSSTALAGPNIEQPAGEFLGEGNATARAPLWVEDQEEVTLTVKLIKPGKLEDFDWEEGGLKPERVSPGPDSASPPGSDGESVEGEGTNEQEGTYSKLPVFEWMTAWIEGLAFNSEPGGKVRQKIFNDQVSWSWQIEPKQGHAGVRDLIIKIDANEVIYPIEFEVGIVPSDPATPEPNRDPQVSVNLVVNGNHVEVEATFTDLNEEDTHSARIEWGDGRSEDIRGPSSPFEAQHDYASSPYPTEVDCQVTVIVQDDQGGEGRAQETVRLSGVLPTACDDGPSARLNPLEGSLIAASALLGSTAILWPGMWLSLLRGRRRRKDRT